MIDTDDISRKLSAAVPVTCILCCSFPDCDPQYFGECELCESIVIILVLVKSLGSGWYPSSIVRRVSETVVDNFGGRS